MFSIQFLIYWAWVFFQRSFLLFWNFYELFKFVYCIMYVYAYVFVFVWIRYVDINCIQIIECIDRERAAMWNSMGCAWAQTHTQQSMQECVCVVQFEMFMKLYKLAECLLLFYRSVSHIFRFQLRLISLCAVFKRNTFIQTYTLTSTHSANEPKQNNKKYGFVVAHSVYIRARVNLQVN